MLSIRAFTLSSVDGLGKRDETNTDMDFNRLPFSFFQDGKATMVEAAGLPTSLGLQGEKNTVMDV